ncbi:hypothetical protein Xcab_01436 [Xenorhabdus cabanillasii JM26]|nr:hypothetical protein Xcab_01436 [Xenorhabdus cabanillasii JM26]
MGLYAAGTGKSGGGTGTHTNYASAGVGHPAGSRAYLIVNHLERDGDPLSCGAVYSSTV